MISYCPGCGAEITFDSSLIETEVITPHPTSPGDPESKLCNYSNRPIVEVIEEQIADEEICGDDVGKTSD
jgi:hypothetical protein